MNVEAGNQAGKAAEATHGHRDIQKNDRNRSRGQRSARPFPARSLQQEERDSPLNTEENDE
ncbi:MAG TPA: hypothetical protein VGH38_34445 [Bryobacteraceae bacterium]|jgi:hypothetical protein